MSVDVHYGDKQGLDRTRRHLVPVARLPLPDEPDLVHLALYQWLPQFDAWATGPGICGRSTTQGPLPDGTAVTCPACEERRPDYERHLAPEDQPTEVRTEAVYRLQTFQPYGAWEISSGPLGDDLDFARQALARRRQRIPDAEHRIVRHVTTETVTPIPD